MKKLLLSSIALAALAACASPQMSENSTGDVKSVAAEVATEIEMASVFLTEDGTRMISWQTIPADRQVEIAFATSPNGPFTGLGMDNDGEFVHKTGDLSERYYYRLTPAGGEVTVTALRLLPLQGGRNFRDLGGYETEDGQTVQWGKLYRSGTMSHLTRDDYRYLSNLGIAVVCDFRATSERDEEPTDWQAGEIDYVTWDYEMGSDGGGLAGVFRKPDVTPEDVADVMTGFYHTIAHEHADKFEAMFDRLAAGEIPLAFNCSAGKDRTGTAAALILTALGVPRDTIVADYALSETYVDYMAAYRDGASEIDEDSPYAFLAKLPPELVAPLMRSDPRYIEAMFATIEETHGSAMAFIQEELNVTDAELAAIRAGLLND